MTVEISDVASVVSAALAAGALGWSFRNDRESRRLSAKLLEIEEARERDRVAATARAELRARFVPPRSGQFNRLRIRNVGAAVAREIQVVIDGCVAGEPGSLYAGDQPPSSLAPDGEWACEIFTSAMTGSHLHVVVSWTNENGTPGRYESDLSLSD